MKNLPEPVRDKAIEIANALLEEKNMDEGIAIATAISRAKDWAANRHLPTDPIGGRKTDVKEHGKDVYVSPSENGWEVKKEGNSRVQKFKTKTEAVKVAKQEAKKAHATVTIKGKNGKIMQRVSYNPHNPNSKVR